MGKIQHLTHGSYDITFIGKNASYSRLYETNFNCFSYKGKNNGLVCLLTTLGKVILLEVHFLNLLLIKVGDPFFSLMIFFNSFLILT